MRRQESKFASPAVHAAALRLAPTIRLTRLARNMTQEAAAERARMSAFTWMKIEKGDVSVSMGSWLSALECLGLLDGLKVDLPPIVGALHVAGASDVMVATAHLGPAPPAVRAKDGDETRQRARRNPTKDDEFDF